MRIIKSVQLLQLVVLVMLAIAVPCRAQEEKATPAPKGQETVIVAGTEADYIIGPGDLMDISVWKDEALTKQVVVLPDNKINFPLIGEVLAGGRTVAQVKKDIEEKLLPYIPEPVLSVEVKQVNSMLIYVVGRVNSPGRFILNTNVNVLQALAISGGLNPFAKRDKIKIFRHEGGKTQIFPFRYDDVADGVTLEQNIQLKRGDVIVVP